MRFGVWSSFLGFHGVCLEEEKEEDEDEDEDEERAVMEVKKRKEK